MDPRTSIPFNRPLKTGREEDLIREALAQDSLSGSGRFTGRCEGFLADRYGFGRVILTTSCTDALEMAALLLRIQPGDEVIMPSYTFVSTANAFVLRGATIVFADSRPDHPGMDEQLVESLVTPRTRAIVAVHYAGVASDMDVLLNVARRHGLMVVEDAAQGIDATYRGRPLGGIGHLGAFSFHDTKNIHCGEGGALMVNDPELVARAEILRDKGTNRAAFYRGEIDKYTWVDVGSSFLPSEISAAFLLAQLEALDEVTVRRRTLADTYTAALADLGHAGFVDLPLAPEYAGGNGHLFYLVCRSAAERDRLIGHLRKDGIQACFHYQSLHASPFYDGKHDGRALAECDRYTNGLVRLPLYFDLSDREAERVIESVRSFYAPTSARVLGVASGVATGST